MSDEDFPQLCETCLGPNPYVRMIKLPPGAKLCQFSQLPYQPYKWKPGPNARYKETIICKAVAREKHICQSCLFDMKLGLTVGARDALLSVPKSEKELPTSLVGLQHHYLSQGSPDGTGPGATAGLSSSAPSLTDGAYAPYGPQGPPLLYPGQGSHGGAMAYPPLPMVGGGVFQPAGAELLAPGAGGAALARQIRPPRPSAAAGTKGPLPVTSFRNLPKLCTFWLNGKCTRVLRGTCPFRPCCGTFIFPELASAHKELNKELVDLLNESGAEKVQSNLPKPIFEAFRKALSGNRGDNIKKRIMGDDDLTRKQIGSSKRSLPEAPEDQKVTTLWIGGLPEGASEYELRYLLHNAADVARVDVRSELKCAFVTYRDRAAAEGAIEAMFDTLAVQGQRVHVSWAKPRAEAAPSAESDFVGVSGSRASAAHKKQKV